MNTEQQPSPRRRAGGILLLGPALLCALLLAARTSAQAASRTRLAGHVPAASRVTRGTAAVNPSERIDLTLTLPLRNQAALQQFLRRVSNPRDPLYGDYLTPAEFQATFAPTQAQYAAVRAFARESGLSITGTHANRLLLDVTGTAAAVESAFDTRLLRFEARDGRVFRAPAVEPAVPVSLAGTLSGVVGLDDLAVWKHNAVMSEGV
jgi:kumamolisin